ncbi:ATP-binding protein [Plantactinospora sonchi]|uniref:ATP-binding protein n=1 Tax=Plantactinospora sonchi TaxID=1544735 RepID=A0ABU7RWE6_9ACTN
MVAAHVETGALVITMAGRWSLAQAYTLQRAFEACTAHHPPYVAVDCTRVAPDGLLPTVLPALVMLGQSCRRGITVLVCAPASALTGAIRRLPTRRVRLYPRLSEALSRLRPYPVPRGVRWAHQRLAPAAQAAASARRLVRDCCDRWRLTDVTDDAQLVVSELVANAVEHAGTEIDVTVSHHRHRLRIAVADRHHGVPRIAATPTDDAGGSAPPALRGRGLALVSRAVAGWGVLPGSDGKVVWASLPTPRPPRLRLPRPDMLSRHGYPA